MDISGLEVSDDLPTPRAWQILEYDGRRTQVWRTPLNVKQLRPDFGSYPQGFQAAGAYHIGIHPTYLDYDLLVELRAAVRRAAGEKGILSVEPFTEAERLLVRGGGDVFDLSMTAGVKEALH